MIDKTDRVVSSLDDREGKALIDKVGSSQNRQSLEDDFTTLLTIRDISQILYIHTNTARRWSNKGILKPLRIGPRGDRRFKRDDIMALLARK